MTGAETTLDPAAISTKPQLPVQVFEDLDRRDEQQILSELRGEIIEDLVYDINIQGRRVTNLSYAGVKEAVRQRGGLEILDVKTEDSDKEIRALVRVRDHQNHIDVLGASAADKTQPFAYTLAVNKAERNAFAKLIPAKWLATLVDDYLERKKHPAATAAKTEPQAVDWHVPTTAAAPPEGVEQIVIFHKTTAVGHANIDSNHNEIALIPDSPIKTDSGPIQSFLIGKFLEPLKTKHSPSFDYALRTEEDLVQAVLVRMANFERLKELLDAAGWAFSKAGEAKPAGGAS